jgi:squalene monooxygenase
MAKNEIVNDLRLEPQRAVHSKEKTFDVCIIGAGVVGTALALYLANHRISVALVERDFSEQDRIVGELLQPDGCRQLVAMGLDNILKEIDAVTIYGYALLMGNRSIKVDYPADALGKGMRNGKFVQALRKQASTHPFIHCIEGKANKLCSEQDKISGVEVDLKDERKSVRINAQLTIAADGFFSAFRKELHTKKPENTGFFVGIILEDIQLPYAQYGHVFMNTAAPVLCYPISTNKYRILIDFEATHVPKKGSGLNNYLLETVKPALPVNMHTAFEKAIYGGNIRSMSNHRLSGNISYTNGAPIIGDALNMRHPLTGGGMTAGLTDAKKLGDIIIQHKGSDKLHDAIRTFYSGNRIHNATINILADALYGVVKDEQLAKACFDYLARGGTCESVPVALLAGLNRDKKQLIYHFFKVALLGALQKIREDKSMHGIRESFNMIKKAFRLVKPLMESEKLFAWEKIILFTGKKIF